MINTKLISRLQNLSGVNKKHYYLSIYMSKSKQKVLNVLVLKPLLILILKGNKIVGGNNKKHMLQMGDFIFFTDIQSITMRNVPRDTNCFALSIEFEFSDFDKLYRDMRAKRAKKNKGYTKGIIDNTLYSCILQIIDSFEWAPQKIIEGRKKEILELMILQGYDDIFYYPSYNEISRKVIDIIVNKPSTVIEDICKELHMSKSTLYRKLRLEGTSIQKIKDNALMDKALHLLQTTNLSIDNIADRVGYSSSFRFSQRFKMFFGITPQALRRTIKN